MTLTQRALQAELSPAWGALRPAWRSAGAEESAAPAPRSSSSHLLHCPSSQPPTYVTLPIQRPTERRVGQSYDAHFSDDKTEAHEGLGLPQISQPVQPAGPCLLA